jgi:hypothetical protein
MLLFIWVRVFWVRSSHAIEGMIIIYECMYHYLYLSINTLEHHHHNNIMYHI